MFYTYICAGVSTIVKPEIKACVIYHNEIYEEYSLIIKEKYHRGY